MLQRLGHVRFIAAIIGCILVLTLVVGGSLQVADAASRCGGADTSIISCDEGTETNGVFSILLMAINILTAGVGIAAVGGIVYGAILYTTAGDSSEQISSAKAIIRNVVIGLILFVGMYALLQYIIPGGILDRELNIPVVQDPPDTSTSGDDGTDSDSNKTGSFRIADFNAYSVSAGGDTKQVSIIERGMAILRREGAEIVTLQELSIPQTRHLKDSSYWAVYRSRMDGDRGIGIAYKRDAFKVLASGDFAIPHPGRLERRQAVVTLERIRDKARITVMSVHLIAMNIHDAGGPADYREYQPQQQKVVKEKALDLKDQGKTVVIGGDFNWEFGGGSGWMGDFKFQGIGFTSFMVPPDQKLSNFKALEKDRSITDHNLILVDVETKSFGN